MESHLQMQQQGSKTHPYPYPLTLGLGSKFTFSQDGHAAYQIKGNHECSNMVAHILPAVPNPPPDPGDRVKMSFFFNFQNMVMLYIKLKRIQNAATW